LRRRHVDPHGLRLHRRHEAARGRSAVAAHCGERGRGPRSCRGGGVGAPPGQWREGCAMSEPVSLMHPVEGPPTERQIAFDIIVTHLGLLIWETRYVSASLAFPGLKPTPNNTNKKRS